MTDVIAAMRDAECKGIGKESQARQELHDREFWSILGILCKVGGFIQNVMISCMMVLQFHIVGRSACVSFL